MNNVELQKLVSSLSETDLRKWCLETAIAQIAKINTRFTVPVSDTAILEMKVAQMDLANTYYVFISTGKTDAKINTSKVLLSATKLLAAREIKMPTSIFNKKLTEAGILEQHEMKGDKGTGTYPVLTEKGLEYGVNKIYPRNKEATQPLYFDHKFDELLNLLGINK